MNKFMVDRLYKNPNDLEQAALWFSQKWGVPAEAYRESMETCLARKTEIPQWYLVWSDADEIVAGAGVIENDFHARKDLSPNLCALFVEEACRGQGIARMLMDTARKEVGGLGFDTLYLVTDHTSFYETCGWSYLTDVTGDDGTTERMYAAPVLR